MRAGAATERSALHVPTETQPRVLLVRVDAARVQGRGGAERRCDVRLMRSARGMAAAQSCDPDGGALTAVVILRDVTAACVASCVRAATHGASVPPELLSQLPPLGAEAPAGAAPQLSDREFEVLRLLADGESTRGIATQLSYSERTVKNIVRDLLVKLNGKTRAHAVALATRHGVI